MQIIDLLKNMAFITALPGREQRITRYLQAAFAPYADEISVDGIGNLIVKVLGSDPQAPKVMVFAHLDQPGFVVRKIESNGFIRMEPLGDIPEQVLPGARLLVESESGATFTGLVGVQDFRSPSRQESSGSIHVGQLYIDIGACSAEEVRNLGVEVGSPVAFQPYFEALRNGRITGTSLDDRGGCAILVQLAEWAANTRLAATLYLVGAAQGEYNQQGALVAAGAIAPDLAICLDPALASDTPPGADRIGLNLGDGPVISILNSSSWSPFNGSLPHPGLVELARQASVQTGIALQRSVEPGPAHGSAWIQRSGQGLAAVDLGWPLRYPHTAIETCELSDLDALSSLVWAMLQAMGPEFKLDRM